MDDHAKRFFLTTVEIRILATVLTRIAHRSAAERFNAHNADISGLQYGILRTLERESFTLSELSKQFVLDPSTLVPAIDALERKGLVMRGRDPHDRRRIPLTLTEDGIALAHELPLFHQDDLLYQCLNEMGEDKTNELRNLLREVVSRMPDGDTMLEAVTTRLPVLGGNVTHGPHCDIQHGDSTNHEPTERESRTTRRRERRRRRSE